MHFQDVYKFWFEECSQDDWWQKSAEFDALVGARFKPILLQAKNGELSHWRQTAIGALCEIIVLDQFSRNMHRDTPAAFENDPQALTLAQVAIEKEQDKVLNDTERSFLYMPFMHSESALIHITAEKLFKPLSNYQFEIAHKQIIDRFGRYPHRNQILGRESTSEEIMFLKQPNSSF